MNVGLTLLQVFESYSFCEVGFKRVKIEKYFFFFSFFGAVMMC